MRVTMYVSKPDRDVVESYQELSRREVDAVEHMPVTRVLAAGGGPEEMLENSFFAPVSDATRTGVVLDDPAVLHPAINLFGVHEEGHIVTGLSGSEVTWGQFVRAAEVGLVDGDTSQLIVFSRRHALGGSGFEG